MERHKLDPRHTPEAPVFHVGDTVRFHTLFLRSTGQFAGPEAPTSSGPWARGEVTEITSWPGSSLTLVTVRWADGEVTRVHPDNLARRRTDGRRGLPWSDSVFYR